MTPDIQARFDANYIPEPNSGCWIWLGSVWTDRSGERGYIVVGPKKRRLAYRVSHELHVGPIPTGLRVCHKCDTPICVNPDHLFAGTQAANVQDMISKGRNRAARAEAPYHRGDSNPCAKLTIERVRAIRASTDSNESLAELFGVKATTIRDVRAGRRWSTTT